MMSGGPSPLPLSHPGEGFPVLFIDAGFLSPESTGLETVQLKRKTPRPEARR